MNERNLSERLEILHEAQRCHADLLSHVDLNFSERTGAGPIEIVTAEEQQKLMQRQHRAQQYLARRPDLLPVRARSVHALTTYSILHRCPTIPQSYFA